MWFWKAVALPWCHFRYFLTRSPSFVPHKQWCCITDARAHAINPEFRELSGEVLGQTQGHVLGSMEPASLWHQRPASSCHVANVSPPLLLPWLPFWFWGHWRTLHAIPSAPLSYSLAPSLETARPSILLEHLQCYGTVPTSSCQHCTSCCPNSPSLAPG